MNKQNKKLNSEQRKLEQASIYTSTYIHIIKMLCT